MHCPSHINCTPYNEVDRLCLQNHSDLSTFIYVFLTEAFHVVTPAARAWRLCAVKDEVLDLHSGEPPPMCGQTIACQERG